MQAFNLLYGGKISFKKVVAVQEFETLQQGANVWAGKNAYLEYLGGSRARH